MTAQEREASLDRLCEQDQGYREDEADEYGDFEPFTAEELAEIRQAAADELLAVEAASTGRRGPGQPGSARVFPGRRGRPVRRRVRGRAARRRVRVGPGRGDRRQQPRYPMLVYGTDSIRNMDEVDHPGRYRPYLWKIWSWPVTSTSAT